MPAFPERHKLTNDSNTVLLPHG